MPFANFSRFVQHDRLKWASLVVRAAERLRRRGLSEQLLLQRWGVTQTWLEDEQLHRWANWLVATRAWDGLVPLMDMLDWGGAGKHLQVKTFANGDMAFLTASVQSWQAGEELINLYGFHSNLELLAGYCFVPAVNIYNTYQVP